MTTHPDLTVEQLDMEHLAEELATMVVVLTPRYHCEIAGKGVENE
jgi:hypothetical protein